MELGYDNLSSKGYRDQSGLRALLAGLIALAVVGLLGLLGVLSGVLLGLLLLGLAIFMGGVVFTQPQAVSAALSATRNYSEREAEAKRLRAMRERERAFYQMTSTLSSTLDYQKVLEAVQDVGLMVTDKDTPKSDLVSAAFLFEKERDRNLLKVKNARGLSPKDKIMTAPGKQGVLALALKQADPVFFGDANEDPELQYYAGFQACKSVLAVPLQANFEYFGVLVFGSPKKNAFSEEYTEFLKSIGTQATIALQNAALYSDILEEKERIVEVEEDARKKLSRDLHDGPTQSVAAIAMRIAYVRRLINPDNDNAFLELGKIEDIARRTTKEIRHMLFTLRPLVLENQGLSVALQHLADKMRETYDLNVLVEAQPQVDRWLDKNAQGVVFYIVEEALNNARKHAQAEHIWVRIYKRDDWFIFEIEDDGVGLHQSAIEDGFARNSLGMVNMRERGELIQGTLDIESQEGVGTKIRVVVPIKAPSEPSPAPEETRPPGVSAPQSVVEGVVTPAAAVSALRKPKPNIPHADKRSPNS